MKYSFPETYGEECVIVAVDKSLLPMIAGALRPFEKRYSWLSDADYEAGYNAFAQVQADMANNCLTELVESHNRLYRLLDTALNGVAYSASGDTPPVVTPAIPAAPPDTAPLLLPLISVRNRLSRLVDLVDNAMNGTVIDAAPTLQPDIRNNLEAIRVLLESEGENTDDVEGLINLVLLALA